MANNFKVLIGSPTAAPYTYCLSEWARNTKALTYSPKHIVLVDNSKSEAYDKTILKEGIEALKYVAPKGETLRETLANSRNVLRTLLLEGDYAYFLSLEQDILPPLDVLERLLAHQQPVVSAVYYKYFTLKYTSSSGKIIEKKKAMPLLAKPSSFDKTKMHFYTAEEVDEDALIPLRYCGLGCVLIRRDVLEQISFRVDMSPEGNAFDDVYFCNDVLRAGYPLYADTSIKCMHRLSGKPEGLFDEIHKNRSIS